MSDQSELEAESAVLRLTKPWTDVVMVGTGKEKRYAPVDHAPMLVMLAGAKQSSMVPTTSGRTLPFMSSPMNIIAVDLWEHIDGAARAWWRELSKRSAPRELDEVVAGLWGMLRSAYASNQIDDRLYRRILGQFPSWCDRIWNVCSPPISHPLAGACSACDESEVIGPEGGSTPALIAYYWKGIRPEAKCQRCGETWVGEVALLNLAYHIKATVDVDTLREMGVAV